MVPKEAYMAPEVGAHGPSASEERAHDPEKSVHGPKGRRPWLFCKPGARPWPRKRRTWSQRSAPMALLQARSAPMTPEVGAYGPSASQERAHGPERDVHGPRGCRP